MPLPVHPAVTPLVESDRRVEPRIQYQSRAQLVPYPPGKHSIPIDVTVCDYSTSGIGVSYCEGLMLGQAFIVREPTITRGRTCLYRVVHSEQTEAGSFRIGLEAMESAERDEWAPFEPPPAPGVDLGTRLLYLIFAIAGAATIVLTAVLLRHRH